MTHRASHQVLTPVLWRKSVTISELEQYKSILKQCSPAIQPTTGTTFKTPKRRRTTPSKSYFENG